MHSLRCRPKGLSHRVLFLVDRCKCSAGGKKWRLCLLSAFGKQTRMIVQQLIMDGLECNMSNDYRLILIDYIAQGMLNLLGLNRQRKPLNESKLPAWKQRKKPKRQDSKEREKQSKRNSSSKSKQTKKSIGHGIKFHHTKQIKYITEEIEKSTDIKIPHSKSLKNIKSQHSQKQKSSNFKPLPRQASTRQTQEKQSLQRVPPKDFNLKFFNKQQQKIQTKKSSRKTKLGLLEKLHPKDKREKKTVRHFRLNSSNQRQNALHPLISKKSISCKRIRETVYIKKRQYWEDHRMSGFSPCTRQKKEKFLFDSTSHLMREYFGETIEKEMGLASDSVNRYEYLKTPQLY